ncbi:hypothetical protein LMH73_020195 [Vibrio splendidus]|nr:hypothetical protein [Vibrio splendidus]MCC4882933.1 hypothetical protein [Vibrio splendidus]
MNNNPIDIYHQLSVKHYIAYENFERKESHAALGHARGDEWIESISHIIEPLANLSKSDLHAMLIFSRNYIDSNYLRKGLYKQEYNQAENLHELMIKEYSRKI